MIALSEYDLKQIILIKKMIGLFKNNKLSLLDLVGNLGGILNALESVPETWENDFRAEINMLEMIDESIKDGSISKWEGDFTEDMNKSVAKLRKMTAFIIEKYLKISDPNILESVIEASANWLICPKCSDAWESDSSDAMVVCPKCEQAFHNPRYHKLWENGLKLADEPLPKDKAIIIDSNTLMCTNCVETWECAEVDGQVTCPKCKKTFSNPRLKDA